MCSRTCGATPPRTYTSTGRGRAHLHPRLVCVSASEHPRGAVPNMYLHADRHLATAGVRAGVSSVGRGAHPVLTHGHHYQSGPAAIYRTRLPISHPTRSKFVTDLTSLLHHLATGGAREGLGTKRTHGTQGIRLDRFTLFMIPQNPACTACQF